MDGLSRSLPVLSTTRSRQHAAYSQPGQPTSPGHVRQHEAYWFARVECCSKVTATDAHFMHMVPRPSYSCHLAATKAGKHSVID